MLASSFVRRVIYVFCRCTWQKHQPSLILNETFNAGVSEHQGVRRNVATIAEESNNFIQISRHIHFKNVIKNVISAQVDLITR